MATFKIQENAVDEPASERGVDLATDKQPRSVTGKMSRIPTGPSFHLLSEKAVDSFSDFCTLCITNIDLSDLMQSQQGGFILHRQRRAQVAFVSCSPPTEHEILQQV